jgi:Flp pilus assembly protein TadG
MHLPHQPARRGAAVVELALLLPFLAFIFIIAVDWARIFYYSQTVTNCARNGAIYSSDPFSMATSPYTNVTAASLADASDLTPAPTVTSTSGTDASGFSYVDVTVSFDFQTVTNFPGVPGTMTIARTVRVYLAPRLPN